MFAVITNVNIKLVSYIAHVGFITFSVHSFTLKNNQIIDISIDL